MNRNVFMMMVAFLVAVTAVIITATLSFQWSFTDTTFGGWLGFLSPPVLAICCFGAGCAYNSACDREITTDELHDAYMKGRDAETERLHNVLLGEIGNA